MKPVYCAQEALGVRPEEGRETSKGYVGVELWVEEEEGNPSIKRHLKIGAEEVE